MNSRYHAGSFYPHPPRTTSGSVRESDYCEGSVKASATSVHLTRRNRLKPLTKYDFEVRARNSGHKGNWSTVSKYIGMDTPLYMFILYLVLNIDFIALYIHMLINDVPEPHDTQTTLSCSLQPLS